MRKNVHYLLFALFWIGVGAVSGYLVGHPFGMPQGAFTAIYKLALPLLGKFQGRTYFDLGLAALVYAFPTILVLGLVLGMVMKRTYHKRLLMYSTLIWSLIYFVENTVVLNLIKRGEVLTGQGSKASSFLSEKFGAEMSIYFLEYSLLFILIFAVHFASTMGKTHNMPPDPHARRGSAWR